MTSEEKELLKLLDSGALDGVVGNELITSGKSAVMKVIKDGVPKMIKQGPSKRVFFGNESERVKGVIHVLQQWTTDEEKLDFLRKFGFLISNSVVRAYSAKFKPRK